MAHTRAERRWFRYVKGMRRLNADRQEHQPYGQKTLEETCDCFKDKASKEFGKIFSRFADHPKVCPYPCCANRRGVEGPSIGELRKFDDMDDSERTA